MTTPDLFTGTADAYARFRPPYPDALFKALLDEVPPSHRLLVDLGCGTGEIAIPLSTPFEQVVAVDIEPEMVATGTAKAAALGIDNIDWRVSRAEDVRFPEGSVHLVTIGAAFHWMDRPAVAAQCLEWLASGHCVAVLGSNSPWTGEAPWQQVAVDVMRRRLGEHRRAGSGTFERPAEPHEVVLAAAGFADVEERPFPVEHVWTLDGFLGYLASTSFAGPEVLGDEAVAFENEMRAELLAYDPSGRYPEVIAFYYIVGRKP